ncbi:nuclear receptor-interacting protein 2 [Pseudophryne corroboree]|uniref:nuclear receptor-interacting protein 2 n=1 Tax=Pseudophryne corroboree TaxID=495146 RepID=UPI003081D237
MSCPRPPGGLGEEAKLRGSPRKEQDLRSTAILHQQRRLKQATQFVHKDSADLLPLDQLRRLGTSKDLQPHSVIQRRLLGGSPVKETSSLIPPFPLCDPGTQPPEEGVTAARFCEPDTNPAQQRDDQQLLPDPPEETAAGWKGRPLLIPCQVRTQDVIAKLCIERQENFISKACVTGLGLEVTNGSPERLTVDIGLGCESLTILAVIVDDNSADFCIGLDTLVTLKSCIDLEHGVLKTPSQEISFLTSLHSHPMASKTEAELNSSEQ